MAIAIEKPITKCPECGNRLVKTSKRHKTCVHCADCRLYPIRPQIAPLSDAERKKLAECERVLSNYFKRAPNP